MFLQLEKLTLAISGDPSSFVSLSGFEVVRGDAGEYDTKHVMCLLVRIKEVEVDQECPNVVGIHLVEYDVRVVVVHYLLALLLYVSNLIIVNQIHIFTLLIVIYGLLSYVWHMNLEVHAS